MEQQERYHEQQRQGPGKPPRNHGLSDARAQELLQAFLEGDDESFERLVEMYSPMIFNVFLRWYRLSPEDAEDLSQETLMQLFLKAGMISNVRPWLLGTAANQAKKRIRRLIRDRNLVRKYEERLGEAGREIMPEEKDLVQKALSGLPGSDRKLLRLMYYSGASYKEASQAMGRPIGSIGPMRSRALERLGRNVMALESGVPAA